MGPTTLQEYELFEGSSGKLTFTITDEDGVVIPAASIVSAVLTLKDKQTGTIINSRTAQNILNANGVTISSAGVLVWEISYLDTAMVGTDRSEEHLAVFKIVTADVHARMEVSMSIIHID